VSKRMGFVGIVIEDREASADRVNQVLSDFGHLVIGRLGLPYRNRNVAVITVIVDGDADQIGALTGKLGNIDGVRAKAASVEV